MNSDFYRYSYFKDPSEFALEHLNSSDGMGHQCSDDFLIDRNYFNNDLIMYVVEGILHVEQNMKHHKLTAGQGIVMRLSQKHKYYSDNVVGASVLWFHFKGKELSSVLNQLDKKDMLPVIFEDTSYESKIIEIFRITKNRNEYYEYSLSEKIYSTVLNAIKSELLLIQNKGDTSMFLFTVDTYIDEHISEKIDLDVLASKFNINKYYFCRKFKKHFNNSPISYINQKKVATAKSMLSSTNYPLSYISEQLGFYDQGHFCKVFKSIAGCSPLKYKNNV